jgi:hypothetical protein
MVLTKDNNLLNKLTSWILLDGAVIDKNPVTSNECICLPLGAQIIQKNVSTIDAKKYLIKLTAASKIPAIINFIITNINDEVIYEKIFRLFSQDYVQFSKEFLIDSDFVNVIITSENAPDNDGTTYIADINLKPHDIPCQTSKMKIKCKTDDGGLGIIPIESIIPNRHNIYSVNLDKYIPITSVVANGPHERFALIEKNIIGPGIPSANVYAITSQTFIINGKKIKARNIPGCKIIKTKAQMAYFIGTPRCVHISVNDLITSTYKSE